MKYPEHYWGSSFKRETMGHTLRYCMVQTRCKTFFNGDDVTGNEVEGAKTRCTTITSEMENVVVGTRCVKNFLRGKMNVIETQK